MEHALSTIWRDGRVSNAGEIWLAATKKAREAGYKHVEAYTPFPIEGLAEAMGFRWTAVPLLTLMGGIGGGLTGFGLQYWVAAITYPLNIGGRPLNSWPAFIPVTFELTVLGASMFAVVGMLALNKLPQPYHPVFNVERFSHASTDKFFPVHRSEAIRNSIWRRLPGSCRACMRSTSAR